MIIVITITVVLASLAVVGARNAKNSAKSAAMLVQLHGIGAAIGGWMSDNNNSFPPCWNGELNQSYAQILDPYMHGVENLRTQDSSFIGVNKRVNLILPKTGGHPITFSMNRAVSSDVTPNKADAAKTEKLVHFSRISRLEKVILLADGGQSPTSGVANASAFRVRAQVGSSGPSSGWSKPIPVGPDADTAPGVGCFRYPHGKCHALMCDGSARAFAKGWIINGNV